MTRLQKMRLEADLSVVNLARLAGVSRNTVMKIEAGEGASLLPMARLARYFGLDVTLAQTLGEDVSGAEEAVR